MKHRVIVENPHPTSMASKVLLTRSLQEQERACWIAFRNVFLDKMMKKYGHLWCSYCGRSGLVAELPEDAPRSAYKHLATLDHIVPKSKGGSEYDEDNLVVACFKCNQRKADMQWVPFWFEGNMWFGMVDSPKKWAELIETYSEVKYSVADLMEAKECVRSKLNKACPKFGFAIECNGTKTLGNFFQENGMPGFIMVGEEKKGS